LLICIYFVNLGRIFVCEIDGDRPKKSSRPKKHKFLRLVGLELGLGLGLGGVTGLGLGFVVS